MGWLWSSSDNGNAAETTNDAGDSGSAKKPNWALTEEQRQRIFGPNDALRGSSRSRDAQADKELETFLNSFAESETKSDESRPAQIPKPSPEPQPVERTNHDRILPDGSLNISPEALYPRTMSCRQAFDQAYYCQGLGGKFNDIYRYGSIQDCSEQWGAFWFCMRTKSLPKPEKERQIVEHYAAREERRLKKFGSSEAVWDIRTKPVEKAFHMNPDTDEEADAVP